MQQKPIIGIVAGEIVNKIEPWAYVNFGQGKPYCDAVIRAGGVPIVLPLTNEKGVIRTYYDMCDGLLFAGGNDVEPSHYGEQPHESVKNLSSIRDSQEMIMMQWALADDMPILAICRGMQLLNVTLGGSLYQDIPTQLEGKQNHDASKEREDTAYLAHQLTLEKNSRLSQILHTTQIAANSRHHQAVHAIGKGLVVNAHAEDGIIEGIELPAHSFVIGVQSHPEGLEAEAVTQWRPLFQAFTDACVVESAKPQSVVA